MRDLQTTLFSLLRGGVGEDPSRWAVGDDRLSAAGRVAIYADMYGARLVEALEAQFPVLAAHCGHERFHALVRGYLAAFPSTSPSLRELGARLAEWLGAGVEPAWLRDLAALEWSRLEVFDGPDETVLTMEALRARAPEAFAALPVRLIRPHRLVSVEHQIEAVWRAASEPAVAVGRGTLLVWRKGVSVFHRRVDSVEESALRRTAPGVPFGVLCEQLAEAAGERAAELAFRLLAQWVTDELLVES